MQRFKGDNQKQTKKPHADSDSFDLIYETDTSGIIAAWRLDNKDSENWTLGNVYEPTPTLLFDSIFESLEIDFSNYSFVDLGSGKGRVLLMAAQFPFNSIVGVEYAADLHLAALNNLDNIGKLSPKCKNITALHMDVLDLEIPEEATVIYLNNPFQGLIIHKIIEKIKQALRRKFRDIFIIYVNPQHSGMFDEAQWLESFSQTDEVKIYRAKPGYFSS